MVNDQRKPLTVYKASAGSGKTFTLATEYIRLLVEDPQSYRTILAVTFTNKATEEMKMRILSQLYGIWKRLRDSESYLEAIRTKTGFEPHLISERAGIALSNLLHNYNYFRVETIDTFFQSVLRNMAHELDLTTNLRIGLNDIQVEEQAVDQLIEQLSTTDVMLQWILKYIMENISDDKTWNIISQMKRFGRTIFRDEYKQVSQALGQKMEEPGFFDHYTGRLRKIRDDAKRRMADIAEGFFDILESEGLTIQDFSYNKSGVCGFFLKLREGVFDASIEGKRVNDCLGNPSKWYTKNHEKRELIHALADAELGNTLRFAMEERPRQWKLYQSATLTLRHLNQLRLLGSIEKKVRELNENSNRFLLSDTQQLLHALIDGSDSPFIFEKIGTQLEHIMIDEFQDTSTVQWQNFRVLLAEAMSHQETSNLIVGDVKQSIYRWRSGDWRLLNGIEQQFDRQQIETRTLDTNYRSDRRVITFNNAFFRHAAHVEFLAQQELNEQEAEQLRNAYQDVEQRIPEKRPDAGFVSVELLPRDDYQERTLQCMDRLIQELMEQGILQRDIAILVRTNSFIPLIARHFMERQPEVRIVSDEAFRLDASQAVGIMIQALRLLVHPDDQLTKATLSKSYQHDILGRRTEDNILPFYSDRLDDLLPEAFVNERSQLLALPLYELAERLFAIFELDRLQEQSAYVCTFYDHLTEFVSENSTDIDAFLAEWDETLCSKTIQSDEINGIRLISIHKSKGLEFGHVIIPFCDWQLEKQSGEILWCRPTGDEFSELPLAPIDYSQKQMMGTIYERDYLDEHLQNAVDNLNLLYVAFTRASHSLHVIGRRKASNSRSALIEQCLPLVAQELPLSQLENPEDEHQPLRFAFGTIPTPLQTDGAPVEVSANPFLQPAAPLPVSITTFDTKVSFRQSNRSHAFIEGDDEAEGQLQNYIRTGSVLHEIFSTIRTGDDIPEALRRLQMEGVLYDDQTTEERITALIRKRLADARVADWFSPRWTLFNECSILAMANDEVIERRPDRVMTDGHDWIVIDFKFGKPKPEHHDQVHEYMSLLTSMGHSPVRGYLWYVYSNKIEEVR